jgi:hypothetical protein
LEEEVWACSQTSKLSFEEDTIGDSPHAKMLKLTILLLFEVYDTLVVVKSVCQGGK